MKGLLLTMVGVTLKAHSILQALVSFGVQAIKEEKDCLPSNYNVERLESDMHAGADPAAKSKAAEFVVDESGIGGFHKSLRNELLPVREIFGIDHDSPEYVSISGLICVQQGRLMQRWHIW
jgi:hypothetical protein